MKKAFTLIELLIVIAIIGILAGILFVSIGTAPLQKSRDVKRVADMQNLRTALTLYYSDNNVYPATPADNLVGLLGLNPTYIPAQPRDPLYDTASASGAAAAAGGCNDTTPNVLTVAAAAAADDYGYYYNNTAGTITLRACLENAANNPNNIANRLYVLTFK